VHRRAAACARRHLEKSPLNFRRRLPAIPSIPAAIDEYTSADETPPRGTFVRPPPRLAKTKNELAGKTDFSEKNKKRKEKEKKRKKQKERKKQKRS